MDKQTFLRRLWLTHKARINASERLRTASKFARLLTSYYSAFLIICAVTSFLSRPSTLSFIMQLSLSLAVFTASLYIPALRMDERAEAFKRNYIDMDDVQADVEDAEEAAQLVELRKRYNQLLQGCENHSTADYLLALETATGETLSFTQRLSLHCRRLLFGLSIISLLGIPLLLEAFLIWH